MGSPLSYPKFRYTLSDGAPAVGYQLYSYFPGSTTPKDTYSDVGLAIPNTNPILLDANGEALLWLGGNTKLVLKDSVGALVWSVDYVIPPVAAAEAAVLVHETTYNHALYDAHLASAAPHTGHLIIAGQIGGIPASPYITGIRETSGPTLLTLGAVGDTQVLRRSGTDLIGVDYPQAGDIVVACPSDVANATTNYADATGLTFNPDINTPYWVQFYILYTTSDTTVGINLAVNGPVSPLHMAFMANTCIDATTIKSCTFNGYDAGTTFTAAVAGENFAFVMGIFQNGSNTGPFILRFAAEAAGTVTVLKNSILKYRKIV